MPRKKRPAPKRKDWRSSPWVLRSLLSLATVVLLAGAVSAVTQRPIVEVARSMASPPKPAVRPAPTPATPTPTPTPTPKPLVKSTPKPAKPAVTTGPPRYIAHAAGGYLGKPYTNNIAAFEHSYQSGYRIFETDLNLTTDGHIVLLHDWDGTLGNLYGLAPGQRDLATILSETAGGPYHIAQLSDLAAWLSAHPAAKVVLDSKADAVALLTEVAQTYPGLRPQFIPYVYSFEQYQPVANLGFTNISLIVYQSYTPAQLVDFAATHHLHSMAMTPATLAAQSAALFQLVHVYIWTINDTATRDQLFHSGAYGVITDWLLPPTIGG